MNIPEQNIRLFEDAIEHRPRQATGKRVLLAWMITS
jgi:hypothetical protein